jgi:hypothetical protein
MGGTNGSDGDLRVTSAGRSSVLLDNVRVECSFPCPELAVAMRVSGEEEEGKKRRRRKERRHGENEDKGDQEVCAPKTPSAYSTWDRWLRWVL